MLVGDFVPDKTFAAVQAKLKKSGIAPVRITAITAPEPMKRLEVALFTDQNVAEAELQKLNRADGPQFYIENGLRTILNGLPPCTELDGCNIPLDANWDRFDYDDACS